MNKIKELYNKYKSIILYLIFGALTTFINIIAYYVFYNVLCVQNVPSTCIAWIISVLFAYITNRTFVFDIKATTLLGILKEILMFFIFRILTGVLDVLIMFFAVDLLKWNSLLWKLLSNVIVIILNYAISKLIVFKK